MDNEDRQKIMQNLVELVEETNLDTLVPKLYERGVFTADMICKYMVSYLLEYESGLKSFSSS
jgi:cobalamin biosynthesis Mg chelatase CobN